MKTVEITTYRYTCELVRYEVAVPDNVRLVTAEEGLNYVKSLPNPNEHIIGREDVECFERPGEDPVEVAYEPDPSRGVA